MTTKIKDNNKLSTKWNEFFWRSVNLVYIRRDQKEERDLRKLARNATVIRVAYKDIGRQEEPAILICRLSLRMRRMYVTSIRLDFH